MGVVSKSLATGVIAVGGVLAMGGVAFALPPSPPTSSCPSTLPSCESLLAYVGPTTSLAEPVTVNGEGTVYYEDETQIAQSDYSLNGPDLSGKASVPSLTLSWTNAKGTVKHQSVTVTVKSLYDGSKAVGATETSKEKKLIKSFTAFNPTYGGSGPNAGSQTGPGTPYIDEVTYKLPSSLTPGIDYTATLHVWDGDSNQDQVSWQFVAPAGSPVAPLFGSDSVAVAGLLMAAAGGLAAVVKGRRARA
ncbi:hypothetical protein [Ferrimicrobium sp.]|uniref:hypothetical protein n=1 Tax=Ferrimicrobium sp. TaxID=2926050 RepID=UPI00260AD73B|nr:hypothetical protein [Ferrimicrobium sp.]